LYVQLEGFPHLFLLLHDHRGTLTLELIDSSIANGRSLPPHPSVILERAIDGNDEKRKNVHDRRWEGSLEVRRRERWRENWRESRS